MKKNDNLTISSSTRLLGKQLSVSGYLDLYTDFGSSSVHNDPVPLGFSRSNQNSVLSMFSEHFEFKEGPKKWVNWCKSSAD